jgi:hypothetical protein
VFDQSFENEVYIDDSELMMHGRTVSVCMSASVPTDDNIKCFRQKKTQNNETVTQSNRNYINLC